MRRIRLRTEGWSHEPVMEAETFRDRFSGLRILPPGVSLLIRTTSVHAWGLSRPFRAVALSDALVVMAHATVRPWRSVSFPGCAFVIELPVHVEPPPIGSRVEVADA